MKAIVSIFIALLIVVVGNYANAEDFKITTKAQNGAKDPGVQVIKEEKKVSDKVSVEDLKDFSARSFDDRVLEFRKGDELITMIPLADFWWSSERKEVFEASQVLAEKLMKVWLEKSFNLRFDGNQEEVEKQLVNLTAAEIRNQFTNNTGAMPTRAEIINAALNARQAAKKLQDKAKFMVEYDELISTFDKYQDETLADSILKEKLTPSAFMFVGSVKLPASLSEGLKKTRYFSGLATILNTSLTFSVSIRPWKVIKRNLNTGVEAASTYYETSTQAWILKDFKTDTTAVKGPLRLGVGLLFGNFNRMANVHGGVLGGSYSFNLRKSLTGDLIIPTHTNVRYGAIASVVETLTGAVDIRNVTKHGYLMITKQFGFQAPMGRQANGDVGAVVNFNAIADRFGAFDQNTLNGIIETALKEIPGADVIVHDNQVEILVPNKDIPPTEPKKETDSTPVNPVP